MMVSAPANAPKPTEGECDVDQVAERIQHVHKFKHFYDQMDFNPEQSLAITKSIIELIDSSEICGIVEGRPRHKG